MSDCNIYKYVHCNLTTCPEFGRLDLISIGDRHLAKFSDSCNRTSDSELIFFWGGVIQRSRMMRFNCRATRLSCGNVYGVITAYMGNG